MCTCHDVCVRRIRCSKYYPHPNYIRVTPWDSPTGRNLCEYQTPAIGRVASYIALTLRSLMALAALASPPALSRRTGQYCQCVNQKIMSGRKATFLYFAYGSNLLTKRIHFQNPSAVFKDVAKLCGYKLEFRLPSKVKRSQIFSRYTR